MIRDIKKRKEKIKTRYFKYLNKQQGSFLKFLCTDKLNIQNTEKLTTENSIVQVNHKPENIILETEISPELSSICSISPKLLKENNALQPTKHFFKEPSSIDFQSTSSCSKLITSESNVTINTTSKNNFNIYDDPANWPISINQNLRTDIVKLGPKRIFNFNFLLVSFSFFFIFG